MKPIQLNNHQLEALKNGASTFTIPIDGIVEEAYMVKPKMYKAQLIKNRSQLQVGDKFYVQEAIIDPTGQMPSLPASEMTYEESRFKGEVVSLEVKQIQNLFSIDKFNLGIKVDETVRSWYNEQYGENAYEDNPYIYLTTHKEIT